MTVTMTVITLAYVVFFSVGELCTLVCGQNYCRFSGNRFNILAVDLVPYMSEPEKGDASLHKYLCRLLGGFLKRRTFADPRDLWGLCRA